MRKHSKILVALGLVVVVTLAAATAVSAQGRGFLGWRPGGRCGSGSVAEILGLSEDDLAAQLKDGKTLADLAEEAGVDLQTLKDAADAECRAAAQEAIKQAVEQAVEHGKLTREQADWMLEGLTAGYTQRGGFWGRVGFLGRGGFLGFGLAPKEANGLEAAAEALGLTVDELALQFWGGRTLADLAERAGVELADVQAAVEASREAAMRAAIEQAVAEGKFTQEQADWMLEGLDSGYMPRGAKPGWGAAPCGPGGRLRGRGDMRGFRTMPDRSDSDETVAPSRMPRFAVRGGAL